MTTKYAEANNKPSYLENESVSQADEFSLSQSLKGDALSAHLDPTPYFQIWLDAMQLRCEDEPATQRTPSKRGEIAFDGVMTIDGYIAAVVRSPKGTLTVTEAAEVDGDILVDTAIVHGLVRGDVTASSVELGSTGQVIGLIQTSKLSFFDGVMTIDEHMAVVVRSPKGTLIVAEAGEVDGDILVDTAIVHGLVRGDITARCVELGSTGRVIGLIHTSKLSIAPGAVFEGKSAFLSSAESQDREMDSNSPLLASSEPGEETAKTFVANVARAG